MEPVLHAAPVVVRRLHLAAARSRGGADTVRRILVPFDGAAPSSAALRVASALALRCRAEVVLMILTPLPRRPERALGRLLLDTARRVRADLMVLPTAERGVLARLVGSLGAEPVLVSGECAAAIIAPPPAAARLAGRVRERRRRAGARLRSGHGERRPLLHVRR